MKRHRSFRLRSVSWLRAVARLLVLTLVVQGLPLPSAFAGQADQPRSNPTARRWRTVDVIPPTTPPLDTRQKMLLGVYLTSPERERVVIAADYLADQFRRSLTPTRVAEIQRDYDRAGWNVTVGSVAERRWIADVYTKAYDQAHRYYGPQEAMKQWMEMLHDPGQLMKQIPTLALEPPSKQAFVGLVLNMGLDIVFDEMVGKGLRQSAQSFLLRNERFYTEPLRLAAGIVSDREYLAGAVPALEGFVRPEVLAYFKPDADVPQMLDFLDRELERTKPRPASAKARGAAGSTNLRPRDYVTRPLSEDELKALGERIKEAFAVDPKSSEAQLKLKLAELDDAQAVFGAMGALLSLSGDPNTRNFGRKTAQLANVIFPTAKRLAERSFEQTAAKAGKKGAELAPLAAAGTVGIIVIAVVTIIQILAEQDNDKNQMAALSGILGQLSQQIKMLHEDMLDRFGRVDFRLDVLISEVRTGMATLINGSALTQIQLSRVTRQLDVFAESLNDITTKLGTVPDVVATELVRAKALSCQAAATPPDTCVRELHAFVTDVRERAARRVLPVPRRATSGADLAAWDRAIVSSASEQAFDYPMLSALVGLSDLAGATPETMQVERIAAESVTNINPQVLDFVIGQLRRLPAVPSEAALEQELTSVVERYQSLHSHFAKNFAAYARHLLERYNGYRDQYRVEMNRVFMRSIGEVEGGIRFSRFGTRATTESLAMANAAAIEKRPDITPCPQGRHRSLIPPKTYEDYAGKYELPARLRSVDRLFKVAESLGIGALEPYCFELDGGWKASKVPGVVIPSTIWFQHSFVRRWNYASPYDKTADKPFFVANTITMGFVPDDRCVRACYAPFENGRDHFRDGVSYPIEQAWQCAFRSGGPACGPQKDAFQARLVKESIVNDTKSIEQLRDIVATRLVYIRNLAVDRFAERASQEMSDDRTALGQAIRGMNGFRHMLEELTWFVYGRQVADIGPAPAFGRAAWLLDTDTIREALKAGEQLGEFLVSPVARLEYDGGTNEQQRATVGQEWLRQAKVRDKSANVESVVTSGRTWAAVFDPLGVLDADDAAPRAQQSFAFGEGLPALDPDFIVAVQGKLAALDFLRSTNALAAR